MSTEVLECLSATFSTDSNTRIRAELRISELFAHPETALSLSDLIPANNVDLPLRQISIVLLRKYINERWSPYFSSFKGNAPSPEIKSRIRSSVFNGLSDPSRKIRASCAHTLSIIADCDWPDEYPDLLNSLINLLSSSSLDSVHGAMQVFSEFIKSELTEDQILPVLRQLLPVLLNILGSTQHTCHTRARAVSVFRQCVTTLYMIKEEHVQAVKEATATILPVWIDAFRVILFMSPQQEMQDRPSWDGLAIRTEIFKTLETLYTTFQKQLSAQLDDFLSSALVHLRELLPIFNQYYLSPSPTPREGTSEEEPVELPTVACAISDFVNSAAHGSKSKSWLQSNGNLENILLCVIGWMQMTPSDEEEWGSDANSFVAQDDEITLSSGVRVSSLVLIGTLMDRNPQGVVLAVTSAIHHIISDSYHARESGARNWWRSLEAGLAALGTVAEDVLEFYDDAIDPEQGKPAEIQRLLAEVIPSLLSSPQTPFLQGRSFVFASQYAKILPDHLAGQYLSTAIEVMESSESGIPIRLSAVKAVNNFCSELDSSVVAPLAERMAGDLAPFLLLTNGDTLTLVLETLASVARIGDGSWLTSELVEKIVTAMLQVWANNNKDPIVVSVIGDILNAFASAKQARLYQSVVNVSLPTLCNAIGMTEPDSASWVPSSAIDLITNIQSAALPGGLGEGFFSSLAPNLFSCLANAEDRDILQNGVVLLTGIVRTDVNQLLSWHNSQGQSGIDNVLNVIAKLLNNEDESGGLVIGDLIIHLLRRAGSAVVSVLPALLQAMVRRMVTAKTATFVQSLVIPFAFLVQSERDTVLSLLEGIDVEGRSGLSILIQTWCENAEVFQGFWPGRVSTLGLCQLFASERPSLQNLSVKGDIIVKPETKDVIVTRSRAKNTPHEFTQVSFPLKALKLLITDLRSSGEAGRNVPHDKVVEVDSDDGDEEWNDEDKVVQGLKEEEYAFLSDMLGPRGRAFDSDDLPDEFDDEDLKKDPISQMDMTAHLVGFLKECAGRNTNNFESLVGQLTVEETIVIQRVLSQSKE